MRILLFFILFIVTSLPGYCQSERQLIRDGNTAYDKGNYKDAEIDYRKALKLNPNSARAKYNLGTSLYKQKNAEEAGKTLSEVDTKDLTKTEKARIFHNLGTSMLQAKKYPESIDAFKKALRNNPDDQDTRYNLSYAIKMLKKQQQQQQQKQSQSKNDKNDQKKQQQQQQQQKQQDQKKDQEKQQPKQQIGKDDAERMLQALKNNEKNTLDKLKKQKSKATVSIEKDW